jgi:hypothetical protein
MTGLTGWVCPKHGFAIDGHNIPTKLTLNWVDAASEVAFKYWGTRGLGFSKEIEAKINDIPNARLHLDADAKFENRNEWVDAEPWGDERNRKVGKSIVIHVNSLELDELLGTAEYVLELWEMYGADDHLLSPDDGYDWHYDDIPGNRMFYYSRLRCLKAAVKTLKKLAARKEDVFYGKA